MLFGQYAKQLRESRSIRLTDAAKRLGISRQLLWDIENGLKYAKKVPRKVVDGMSVVYKVPVGVILEITEIKVNETKILSEHLADTIPLVQSASRLAADMVTLSREYSPELEARCIRLYDMISDLKTRLDNAYHSLYPNTRHKEQES